MGQRIAIYTRLSKDESGTQTATARQEAACRSIADARGWDVVDVYTDVDLSAYRRDVARPGYEQLLAAVRGHQVDGVLVWKLDRLVRRPAEFERFWSACDDANTFLASATEPIDSSTELGLVIVRVLVAFASLESATMSLRLRAQKREAAQRGAHPSGARRFGHTADWTALVDDEADLLRDAARRIVAGDSVRSIVLEWSRIGVRTPAGKPWTHASLRAALLAPRTRGMRVHHGEIVAQGTWPAILDPELADAVAQVLTDPSRRSEVRAARSGLLTGILRCARCGAGMRRQKRNGKPAYACHPGPEGTTGCGGMATVADAVDELVVARVLERLDGPGLAVLLADDGTDLQGLVDEVAELEASLEQLARDHYADRTIGRGEYLAARQAVEQRLDASRRTLLRRRQATSLPVDGRPLAALWPDLDLIAQRAVLRTAVDRVVCHPVGKGRNRFQPDRFEIVWA